MTSAIDNLYDDLYSKGEEVECFCDKCGFFGKVTAGITGGFLCAGCGRYFVVPLDMNERKLRRAEKRISELVKLQEWFMNLNRIEKLTPLEDALVTAAKNSRLTKEDACDRIIDMLRQDDGQAWKEAEKFLERHGPRDWREKTWGVKP